MMIESIWSKKVQNELDHAKEHAQKKTNKKVSVNGKSFKFQRHSPRRRTGATTGFTF